MKHKSLFFMMTMLVSLSLSGIADAQEVYKWTDASGQAHYSQKKPETTDRVQTLDISLPPPADPSSTDVDDEVARLNTLSKQMAREREEAEKARQEQAIRDLEQKNKALENALLKQQVEQQQSEEDDSGPSSSGYPPVYPYPPVYYPYPPAYPPDPLRPPYHQPCQPPACQQPMPPSKPAPPLAKPNPPFRPPPAGLAPTTQGVFRGR